MSGPLKGNGYSPSIVYPHVCVVDTIVGAGSNLGVYTPGDTESYTLIHVLHRIKGVPS